VTDVAVLPRASYSTTFTLEARDLQLAFPQHRFIALEPDDPLEKAAAAEAAVGFGDAPRIRALLDAAPRLRWWSTLSAGVQDLVEAGVVGRPGLTVTNNRSAYTVPVAEHAVAAIMAAAKNLPGYERARQRREWRGLGTAAELRGATLVIYGMGNIGGEVARLGAGLGMRVTGIRRGGEAHPGLLADVVGPERLAGAVAEADYLVLCAPLTPETRGAISAAVIARMKPTAWLVNVARGPLVDELALASALAAGRLGGAALDSFAAHPLPAASPLWGLENVILTPHWSGSSPHLRERSLAGFAANLERFGQGRPLLNVIDPVRGY